ncbi:hypothetical protein [Nocardia sp. NPDC047648]|uniref:hypothetical protein n=1 Tax=Nocardia sp. NPDC047648 TaxID=3155625 RepID=UPI0033E86470
MADHEGLWLAIAAAAPIIALADAVVITPASRRLDKIEMARDKDPGSWPVSWLFARISLALTALSMILSVLMLFTALLALAGHDFSSPTSAAVGTGIALALIMPQVACDAFISYSFERQEMNASRE